MSIHRELLVCQLNRVLLTLWPYYALTPDLFLDSLTYLLIWPLGILLLLLGGSATGHRSHLQSCPSWVVIVVMTIAVDECPGGRPSRRRTILEDLGCGNNRCRSIRCGGWPSRWWLLRWMTVVLMTVAVMAVAMMLVVMVVEINDYRSNECCGCFRGNGCHEWWQ